MALKRLKLSSTTWHGLRKSWSIPLAGRFISEYPLAIVRSGLALLQNALLANAPAIEKDPVIVLGFWRSGTSLLHELLALDDRFCFPSNYDCLNPHHFALTKWLPKWRKKETVGRPQDGMLMTWESPQEDEFALLALGARSPYEWLLMPDTFGKAMLLSDPKELSRKEKRRWENIFMGFLRGVSLINGGRRIFLKSPAHGYRVDTIRHLLPNAKFVVIVRNPYDILESMVTTYKAFAGKYGLSIPLSDEVRKVLLKERLRYEEKMAQGLRGLPSDSIVTVRYEQLASDPIATVRHVYERLKLPDFEYLRPKLQTELQRRKKSAHRSNAPDPYWKQQMSLSWGQIFEHYGYAVDQNLKSR